MAGENTLAYYNVATIMPVTCFIVQTSDYRHRLNYFQTRVVLIGTGKHSSLLQHNNNYGRKKLYSTGYRTANLRRLIEGP